MPSRKTSLAPDIRKAAVQERLAQGYIFFGEDHAASRAAALALANFLERGVYEAPHRVLSELFHLVPGKDGSIGIDAVRRVQDFLWQTPQTGSRRTALIDGAEYLTREAEHALLKIAEEPPAHGLLIILARDPGVLLPTIQSRLGKVHFGGLKPDELIPHEARAYGKRFLAAAPRARSAMIQELLDDESEMFAADKDKRVQIFLAALLLELRSNPRKNMRLMRLILQKQGLIVQYNVNKRLQLEVINQLI